MKKHKRKICKKSVAFSLIITMCFSVFLEGILCNELVAKAETSNYKKFNVYSFECNGGTAGAILENKDLYCWGDNNYGQVGNGTSVDQKSPVKVLDDVEKVYPGSVTAAIRSNGDLYCWGRNDDCQVGNGTNVNQGMPIKILENVKCFDAAFHSIALTNDGDMYCWGFNRDGQVGNGTTSDQSVPVKILSDVKKITAGRFNTFALTNDGDLYIWGDNSYGQIGDGTTTLKNTPQKTLSDIKDFSIDNDGYGLAAISNNGDMYAWGWHTYGGSGSYKTQTTPQKLLTNIRYCNMSNGYNFYAITEDDDLYCWGYNKEGQVGNGTATTSWILYPQKVLSDVSYAKCGNYVMFAKTKNDDLYAWGKNSSGSVGDGTTINVYKPKKIMENVLLIDASSSVMVLTKEHELYTWGYGAYGNIGNGATDNVLSPIKILSDISDIRYKSIACYAISDDGTLYGWGYNYYAQLGVGDTKDRNEPCKILSNLRVESTRYYDDNSSGAGSETKNAPIIKSADLYVKNGDNYVQYDIFTTPVNIAGDNEELVMLNVDIDTNGIKNVDVYITQGAGDEFIKLDYYGGNLNLNFNPATKFSPGKTIYIIAVDRETGESLSKATKLNVLSKVASGSIDIWNGSSGKDGLNFKLGKDVGFTLPDDIPVFGGTDIKWGFEFIPLSVEYDREDDNKINIVFGTSLLSEKVKKDGEIEKEYFKDFDFKSYKDGFNKAVSKNGRTLKQLRNDFKISNDLKMNVFGGRLLNGGHSNKGGNISASGYAEMKYKDGKWIFTEGKIALDAVVQYSYQGQAFIWVVPVYYEFGGNISADIEGKIVNINPVNFTPEFEAYLSAAVGAKIGGGVGVANVATAGVSGEGSLNIKTALHKEYTKSWLEGSANCNVKLFGKEVAKKVWAKGEYLIYETGNDRGLIKDIQASLSSVDDIYDTIDINSIYENESREYAKKTTQWLSGEEKASIMSVEYTNKKLSKLSENIYTESEPQICEVDGKKIMIMQWDNTERAASDRTMLVYSVYDEESKIWSEPAAVDDDGTADFYPCFKDGYLVWQNEKNLITDEMTLKDIAQLGEICITRWNGSGFDEISTLTNNSTLDTQPKIAVHKNGASVVWTTNTEDDILGVTGKNSIMKSEIKDTGWSVPTVIKSDLNSIVNISVGEVNGKFVIAYVVDDDNDLSTINDRDIRIISENGEIQLTNNEVLDSNPVFVNNKIYYYSEGNIAYSDIDSSNYGTVFTEAKQGLTDTFVADDNLKGDIAIWWTKTEENSMEIYSTLYQNGRWSDEIKVTDVGNKAKYPNGILNDDGSMIIAFNNAIVEENDITQTDLYTISVEPSYDIEIVNSYFDEETMTAYVTVKNNGELEIPEYTVSFENNNSKTISEALKAGEIAEIKLEYNKPSVIPTGMIKFAVSINSDEYNTENNTVSFEIGHADIVVDKVETNEDETVISAEISNIGYANADNVKVSLCADSADGDVIEEKIISVNEGDMSNISFNLNKSEMDFEKSTKLIYIKAEIEEEEISEGNNDGYAIIMSESGKADYELAILRINMLSEKSTVNVSATNNRNADKPCSANIEIYSSDEELKATASENIVIPASNDVTINIEVNYVIQDGDKVKVYLRDSDNKEIKSSEYLNIETFYKEDDYIVSGADVEYDGKTHSIMIETLNNAADATVTYSTDSITYSEENPTFTDGGKYTVYYKISKDGYATVSGSEEVVITAVKPTVSILVENEAKLASIGNVTDTYKIKANVIGVKNGSVPTGKVEFNINGTKTECDIINGVAELKSQSLVVDENIIKANYVADENEKNYINSDEAVYDEDSMVSRITGTASVSLADWAVGEDANKPVPLSGTNGIENVTYQYKVKGADDSTYTDKVPEMAGEYTVKAVFAQTDMYAEISATTDFVIKAKYMIMGTIDEGVEKLELKQGEKLISGTISENNVTFKDVAEGQYELVITLKEGYTREDSNNINIDITSDNYTAFIVLTKKINESNTETITINAIGKYADEISITETIAENDIIFNISSDDKQNISGIILFVAEYDESVNMTGVKVIVGEVKENNLVLMTNVPAGRKYKLMLWDRGFTPIIMPIAK